MIIHQRGNLLKDIQSCEDREEPAGISKKQNLSNIAKLLYNSKHSHFRKGTYTFLTSLN